ncbi:MAG: PQQ-dependent sugar dehydrogenase [Deltaproteobacteria bacterium]|nr:PQQ-dependent sugar dehydrogenase [Deltaproteobacteria bacterium]MBK8714962.1 PQQ-dependent sugar dehydrogenase [Deltaproteobacteria bacterium]
MASLHRSALVTTPLGVLLWTAIGCGDGGGGGTAADSSSSGGSTGTTASTTQTTTASTTDSTTTASTTASSTVADSSSSQGSESGSGSTTDTGVLPCPYEPVEGEPAVSLQLVANGFDRPVLAIGHPTEPDRLFVAEQGGTVRILEPGETSAPADTFLDIPVNCATTTTIGCEQGLLGFAFHPDFPTDPRVYVAYSPPGVNPPTRVSEFMLADDSHVDPDSQRVVIEAGQPFGNHNGGMIAFGPDGYLYFGTGDGGDGYDTAQTGMNPGVILAKILRIDVEPDGMPDNPVACIDAAGVNCPDLGPFDYTIPADNPFVDDGNFAPEVWAWGFRNPWRFSFDADNGDLWVGDVGQDEWEEIDIAVAGRHYGWSAMEGNHCENDPGCDASAGPNQPNDDEQYAPIFEYHHQPGCSIAGGAVYRSCEVPAWQGIYVYGDFCSRDVYGLRWDGTTPTDLGSLLDTGELVLGSGWNTYGDVFITTVAGVVYGPYTDGSVYRVAPAG